MVHLTVGTVEFNMHAEIVCVFDIANNCRFLFHVSSPRELSQPVLLGFARCMYIFATL